ncbi:hypothetical protein K2Y11_13925 [bacterium]|nr:hypothetical protein [bacterium]
MRLPFSLSFAGISAGTAVIIASAWGDDPKPAAVDPATEIIEKLIDESKNPPPAAPSTESQDDLINPLTPETPRVPGKSTSDPAAPVIKDVVEQSRASTATNLRNAAVLFKQAMAADTAGRLSDAVRLISQAQKLDPTNAEMDAFAESLHKKWAVKSEQMPAITKGSARLAAALSRGRSLIDQGRYAEGVDLLNGVCKASSFFPSDANIAVYRRNAERDLANYRDRVAKGIIRPDDATEASMAEEPVLVPIGAAAPLNARRILRTAENATPTWYSRIKDRLAFKMNVDFVHEPMADVFEAIEQATGIKILIDDPVMKSRAHLATRVDFRISEVSAETILDIACEKSGLEYVIMERGLVVTTPSRAARYLQDLPESVRDNWLAARVVFPDLTPELLALPPLPNSLPGEANSDRTKLDRDLPYYLRSGDALVKDIQSILKQG